MPLEHRDQGEGSASAAVDRGPSWLPPALVCLVGAGLAVLQLVRLVQAVPVEGQPRPMKAMVHASALAVGGFSLTRLLQLLALARNRRRRRAAGQALPEVSWQLLDAHSLHGVWVVGVGGSVALMGGLGLWSLLDGRPSGLEPGWPLLLIGGAVMLLGHLARQRTTTCWEDEPGYF